MVDPVVGKCSHLAHTLREEEDHPVRSLVGTVPDRVVSVPLAEDHQEGAPVLLGDLFDNHDTSALAAVLLSATGP